MQLLNVKLLVLTAVCLLLTGCKLQHELNLETQQRFSVIVYTDEGNGLTNTATYELLLGEPRFSQVSDWLNDNRDGWEKYIVTEPWGKALLRGDAFDMIVDDTFVLLRYSNSSEMSTRLIKELAEPELAFLYTDH